jgi:hypothetical protein
MSSITTLKEYLKSQACSITTTKQELKKYQKDHNGYDGGFYGAISKLTHDYRHKHIAYCLMRGTPYDAIEKPRQGNEPDMALVRSIRDAYSTSDVHSCS